MARLNATGRTVSLREVTTTGGNARLGVGGVTTVSDTVMVPTPVVEVLDAAQVANSGGILSIGDYRITIAGSAVEDEFVLRNRQIVYGDEVLQVRGVTPSVIFGVVAAYQVIARAITPGSAVA